MSTTKKNKTNISETLLEMDKLTKAIKEESRETISQLLSEAVRGAINEAIEDDEDEYEIEDDATDNSEMPDETPETDFEGDEEAADMTEDDEWSEFEDFKVGDDTYDLASEEGDDVVAKVYKLLKDDDQVVIRQDGDNLSLKDNETGAEYLVKTGCSQTSCPTCAPSANSEMNEDFEEDEMEFEFDETDESDDDFDTDDDFNADDEFESDDDFDVNDEEESDEEEEFEFEVEEDDEEDESDDEEENNDKEDKTMKEGKEMVFEIDLGYTDNYQDKDPIKGLSNNEPSKSGKSWHKGVPTGTNKPWAGKGSSKPFDKKVSCCEDVDLSNNAPVDTITAPNETEINNSVVEGTNVTLPNRRKKSKSHSMQQKDYPKVAHQDSKNGVYKALEEACKKLQKENKELKAIIPQIKNAMNESVIVNYKLGRIVKLFSENTTTRKEKVDIINRFNEDAKTINETKALYESIKRELNNNPSKSPVFENRISTAEKASINETTVYQSNDVRDMINLINRIERK